MAACPVVRRFILVEAGDASERGDSMAENPRLLYGRLLESLASSEREEVDVMIEELGRQGGEVLGGRVRLCAVTLGDEGSMLSER
jgi:hypothetical protein